MTYEELMAAGAEPGDEKPKGKGLTYEQLLAAGAEPVATHDPRPLRGMRPDPKADEVDEIMGDYGKRDVRRTLQGRQDRITLPGAGEERDKRAVATDPIHNDPLAGAILQGLVGYGAGAAATPIVGQLAGRMIGGAVSSPDDPLAGAALAAIPGVPTAARNADRIVGNAAQARVAAGKSFVPAGTAAGTAAGTMAGHAAVPYVGAPIGAALGAKGGAMLGRAADRGVESLANRRVMQMAKAAPPAELPPGLFAEDAPPAPPTRAPLQLGSAPIELGPISRAPVPTDYVGPRQLGPMPDPLFAQYTPPARPAGPMSVVQDAEIVRRTPLAPLVPQGPTWEQRMAPHLDEISGDLLTNAGKPSPLAPTHATVGGKTGVISKADIARDAAAFRAGAPEASPVNDVLGEQLAKSVRLLDELRAGAISIDDAVAAGLPRGVAQRAAR